MTAPAQRIAQPASTVPVFHVHDDQVRAIPAKARGRLVCALDSLLRYAKQVDGLVMVYASRGTVADRAGVSEQTMKRYERELQALGLVRQVATGHASRQLEILPPPRVPLRPIRQSPGNREGVTGDPLQPTRSADRAVDNSAPEMTVGGQTRHVQGVTADPLPPILPFLGERKRESCRAREARPEPAGRDDRPRSDFADRASGRLLEHLEQRLARRGDGDEHRLRPSQRGVCRAALRRRIEANGSEGLTLRDLDRVLDFAERRGAHAGYVAGALKAGDWLSHFAEGSEAARVRDAGPEAEMPVHHDERDGPPEELFAGDLGRARERLARAIERAPVSPEQRAQLEALTPTTAGEANEIAASLERAAAISSLEPCR